MENPFRYSNTNKRYHTFTYFLEQKFGRKVAKISLDAGFTCPNIDGSKGVGGCTYCSARGSGDFAGDQSLSLREQFEQVRQVMDDVRPDAVIHCAAWTAVDLAEDADKQPKVRAINVDGTAHLAAACRAQDCKMMYISTDYVFNGRGQTPWQPDCKDYQPLNYYGETKLGGELAVSSALEKYFIVRIAWVFGLNGKNFIKTMLQLGKTHDKLRVVCDQIGTPTYTLDLARLLADMIESDKYGYYHATNEGGYITSNDKASEIIRHAGLPVQVDAVTTAEYGASKAARPFNSRLDKSKLAENGFTPLPDWKDALSRYLKELGTNQ